MKKGMRYGFALAAGIFLLPVLATIIKSFAGDGKWTLQGYDELFFECFSFYTMFWNSIIYAAVITVLELLVIVPAAFSFSFAKFRWKGMLFFLYIVLMMMPLQVMILPNYIGLRDMGLQIHDI